MKSILYKAGLTVLFLLILLSLTMIIGMKFFSYRFPEGEINFLEKVEIGGMYQWIMVNGKSKELPVLLWLHGGPGASQMPVARYFNHRLEEEFIVVHHHKANIVAHRELKTRILEEGKDKDMQLLESFSGPPYEQREDYVSFARLLNKYNMNFDAKLTKLARVALFSGSCNIADLIRWVRGSNRGSGPMWE